MFLSQSPRRPGATADHLRVQALLGSYASAGTQLDLCYPDNYPGARVAAALGAHGLHSELPYAMSPPALIQKTVWAERNGYDAVVQSSGVLDPGVEAARLAVRIPVIGLCRTSVHFASVLADRIGVTVPFDGYVIPTQRLLRSYGLERIVIGVASLGMSEVPHGDDAADRASEIFDRAARVMRSLVCDRGAECIVPLGGAFIPYIVSPADLARRSMHRCSIPRRSGSDLQKPVWRHADGGRE